jgi:hypothetical protein
MTRIAWLYMTIPLVSGQKAKQPEEGCLPRVYSPGYETL